MWPRRACAGGCANTAGRTPWRLSGPSQYNPEHIPGVSFSRRERRNVNQSEPRDLKKPTRGGARSSHRRRARKCCELVSGRDGNRPVGDIVPEPPRRHAQLRRGCWVPASRAVRSSASAREICPAHARPRAPARAAGAPSRPRRARARRERRCGARTDAREQPSASQQLAPSEHRSRRIRRDPRDPRVGPRGAAAPHATPAESAGATERLLRPPGRVIIGPLDGAAEHGPRRRMDQDDDPRREAALRDARRAAAGPPSRQSLAIHRPVRKPGRNTRENCPACLLSLVI